jgi:opacity protein-like surface antigen
LRDAPKFALHRVAIMVAAVMLASAAIATDALAYGGGHFGGGSYVGQMSAGHFGGAMNGGHGLGTSVSRFGEKAEHQRHPGGGAPYGDYDDNTYYDPSTAAPDEQTNEAPVKQSPYAIRAYPGMKYPRSHCSTQTYTVPSEAGGEASINVVRC